MSYIKMEGFHGTGVKNITSIFREGFITKHREDHWLGQGIYFYDNFDLAFWWIKCKLNSPYGHRCGVIKAVLECDSSEFLNLDSTSGMDYFVREIDKILTNEVSKTKFKFAIKEEDSIQNLCFALDLLKHLRGIKLISRTFPSKSPEPTYASESIPQFEKKHFIFPLNFTYVERQMCATSNEVVVKKYCLYPKNRTNWT